MPAGPALVQLDVLGPAGAYRARTRTDVRDVRNTAVAQLSLVPALFVSRAMSAMRRSRPMLAADRATALRAAGDLFAEAVIAGLGPDDYQRLVSKVAGLEPTGDRAGRGGDRPAVPQRPSGRPACQADRRPVRPG